MHLWQILVLRAILGGIEQLALLANVMMGEIVADHEKAKGKHP